MLYLPLMQKSSRYRIAVFFTILFMALISAPTIILSFDDSVDVSIFYSINEEEENQNVKLIFEKADQDIEMLFEEQTDATLVGYAFKNYPKPHLNLISPPPDSFHNLS